MRAGPTGTIRRSAIRGLAFVALIGLALSNPAGSALAAPATDQALDTAVGDYQRTVGEAVFVHAATGCLTGALVGFLGGGTARAIQGCAFGAGGGAVIGIVSGTQVADQKRAYAQQEQSLDKSIAQARQRNAKLKEIVAMADSLVAQRRKELEQQPASGGDLVKRRETKDSLTAEIKLIDAAIAKARDDEAKLKGMAEELRGTKSAPAAAGALSSNRASTRALEAKRRDLDHLRASA